MITLTPEIIYEMMNNGAPTRAQVEAIGMKWPLKSGWLQRLVGKQIQETEYRRISDARTIRAGQLRKMKKAQKKANGTPTLPSFASKPISAPNPKEYHRKVGLEPPLISHMFQHAFLSGVKHARIG